jgi:Uma2 family endonuclease
MSQTIDIPPGTPGDFIAGRVLLRNISWDTYTALLDDVGDSSARLTYDHGLLEIEVPSRLHELIKAIVAEMLATVMKRLGVPYEPAGATTWRKHASLRGLEADECYHIQSVDRVIGKSELDLSIDPPPDLAIEIQVIPPAIDKVDMYRGLGVPELWRVHADSSCEILVLDDARKYHPAPSSAAIPPFTPAVISHYLLLREQFGHSEAMKRFEAEFIAMLPRA